MIPLQAQFISYKKENKSNTTERKVLLDIYRSHLKKEFQREFKFVVNTFNVSKTHAWLMADVVNINNEPVVFPEDTYLDCCHVEAFYKKVNGKWQLIEYGSFSTDVWYAGIWERYKLPKSFFE